MWITSFFTQNGIPASELSPTLNITRVSDDMPVVVSGVMLEMGSGSYKYDFTGYEITEDYFILCDGGPTLSDYERYTDGSSGEYNNTLYSIDTTISGVDVKVESIDTKVDIIDLTADTIKSTTDDIKSTVDDIDVRTILIRKIQTNKLQLSDGSVGNWTLYDDPPNEHVPLLTFNVTDKNGNAIVQPALSPSKRSKGV